MQRRLQFAVNVRYISVGSGSMIEGNSNAVVWKRNSNSFFTTRAAELTTGWDWTNARVASPGRAFKRMAGILPYTQWGRNDVTPVKGNLQEHPSGRICVDSGM